jgi:hypothetical protein
MPSDDALEELHRANDRLIAAEKRAMADRMGVDVVTMNDLAFLAFGRDYSDEHCERAWLLIDEWCALLEDHAPDDDLDAVAEAASAEVTDTMHDELRAARDAWL